MKIFSFSYIIFTLTVLPLGRKLMIFHRKMMKTEKTSLSIEKLLKIKANKKPHAMHRAKQQLIRP